MKRGRRHIVLPALPHSVHVLATIHRHVAAGHEPRRLTGDECNQCGDFLRPSQTTHGNTGSHLLDHFLRHARHHLRIQIPRRDGVDCHTLARHLLRKGFSEAMHAGFCGGVVGLAELPLGAVDRGDVDDPAPAAFEHAVDEWPGDVENGVEIDPQDRIPIGVAQLAERSITRDATFRKLSYADWDAVLRVNLDSVFNVTRPFIDGMLERGWGRIVNISSINGSKGQFGQTNYSAAKAGMHGFTKALAQEVARKGVTVNTVSPGYLDTKMVTSMSEEVVKQVTAGIPVGRLGRPEEIAALVAFIASESAGFMTGSNVSMNGGQHMY